MNCTCREQTLELLNKQLENYPDISPATLFLDMLKRSLSSLPPCQCGETIGKAVVDYAELQMKASQWFQHSQELTALKRLYDQVQAKNLEYLAFANEHSRCDEDRRQYALSIASIKQKLAHIHDALNDLL